jgi:hypothetical protein
LGDSGKAYASENKQKILEISEKLLLHYPTFLEIIT